MGTHDNLEGTSESSFQVGINGPRVKSFGTGLEAKNAADSALVVVRVADATTAIDALNLGAHENVDSLIHNLAETCFTELTRDGSNRVTNIIVWDSPSKVTKIRETNLTRTSGRVSQIVRKQYNPGGTLVQTVTSVIARSGGRISTITDTETLWQTFRLSKGSLSPLT